MYFSIHHSKKSLANIWLESEMVSFATKKILQFFYLQPPIIGNNSDRYSHIARWFRKQREAAGNNLHILQP